MNIPEFSKAALENIEETNVDWRVDLAELRRGKVPPEMLLRECLDGAGPDRVQGWKDYVAALVAML